MNLNIVNKTTATRKFLTAFGLPVVISCFLIFISGCKAKKPLVARAPVADTTTTPKPAVVDTRMVTINAIKTAQTYFSTFSGKARTKLSIDGDENDVTLNIRIQRDKKIWVSITAIAGIEVARALITPDSIFLINRLQSVYVKKPFSYVYQYTGKEVSYKTVESLVIGNAIPESLNENPDIQIANGATILTSRMASMVYVLAVDANHRASQLNLTNPDEAETLQVNNSAFAGAGGKVIPLQIDMSSTVKNKKIVVNLHYIKEEFDQPLEYPFTIPSRYEPAG
jgi:hypothetical protein